MIYGSPTPFDPIDQADLVEGCPLTFVSRSHTVRVDLLLTLCQRGQRRARLLSPYREHLAKHFADTFSRIGLPVPYVTES